MTLATRPSIAQLVSSFLLPRRTFLIYVFSHVLPHSRISHVLAHPDPKIYKKAKRKFESAVESTFYTTAVDAILPAYYLPKLVEHLNGKGPDGKPKPIESLAHLESGVTKMLNEALLSEMTMLMEKVAQ